MRCDLRLDSQTLALRKDTLDWIIPRRLPIIALKPTDLQEAHDLDGQDIAFLSALASDSKTAQIFWTTCFVIKPLVDCGHEILSWLHSCVCGCEPKAQCPLKGRRAIELACGKFHDFLKAVERKGLTKWAVDAHVNLSRVDSEVASNLLSDWKTAKANIILRLKQNFGFWEKPPWSILRVAEVLVDDSLIAVSGAMFELKHFIFLCLISFQVD